MVAPPSGILGNWWVGVKVSIRAFGRLHLVLVMASIFVLDDLQVRHKASMMKKNHSVLINLVFTIHWALMYFMTTC